MVKRFLMLGVLLGGLSGCSSINYYMQSISGQMEIWRKEKPIESLLQDPQIEPGLKVKLEDVLQIRQFASKELLLPDNQSYKVYANLERPFVAWNVFATDEFSVKPQEWCFPIAGCVGYRGYFSKSDAEQFADNLKSQGHDIFIGGVPAYSTLGWFDDPILNTFIHYSKPDLARLIFHELAHQLVYVPNDSVFNESFAVAVEQEGMRRWFAQYGSAEQREKFDLIHQRHTQFAALLLKYRKKLNDLYNSEAPLQEKRIQKNQLFTDLRVEYQQIKANLWNGYNGYDKWMAQDLNNAALLSVAIYSLKVPAFETLLKQKNGDLKQFYEAVKEMSAWPNEERNQRLSSLINGVVAGK
jgi:predicted aminopeptidase